MLVLFFTIIFIAELIIATWLISHITAFNKEVCDLNAKVIECQPQIKEGFDAARKEIAKVLSALNKFVEFMTSQGINCKEEFKKCLMTKILMAILKIPVKQIATIIDIALVIKKFLNK